MKLFTGMRLANGVGNGNAGQYSCDVLGRIDGQSQFVGKLNCFLNDAGQHVYRFVGTGALKGESKQFTSSNRLSLYDAAERLFDEQPS